MHTCPCEPSRGCKRAGTYSLQFFGVRRPLPVLLPQRGTEPAQCPGERTTQGVSCTDCPPHLLPPHTPPPAEVRDPGSSPSFHRWAVQPRDHHFPLTRAGTPRSAPTGTDPPLSPEGPGRSICSSLPQGPKSWADAGGAWPPLGQAPDPLLVSGSYLCRENRTSTGGTFWCKSPGK